MCRLRTLGYILAAIPGVAACSSVNPPAVPMEPVMVADQIAPASVTFDRYSMIPDGKITGSASGGIQVAPAADSRAMTSCAFSSDQRKNTFGYEIDPSRHIAFKASPSFDLWNPDDFEAEFSLRFTKALGGPANKRPCTFGSGYYGLVPYLRYNADGLPDVTHPAALRSFIKEKLDERDKRARQRQDTPL